MVRRCHGLAGPTDADAAGPQPGKGLWARDLVDQVQIDGQDGRGAGVLRDDMVGPDLLDDGARWGHPAARCGGA